MYLFTSSRVLQRNLDRADQREHLANAESNALERSWDVIRAAILQSAAREGVPIDFLPASGARFAEISNFLDPLENEPICNLKLKLNLQNLDLLAIPSPRLLGRLKVTHLDLKKNSISTASLTHFVHLRSLNLSQNRIRNIPSNLPSTLTGLDLSKNEIREVSKKALKDVKNLKKLDLNTNQIETVAKKAFKKLEQIRVVLLGTNPIKHLYPKCFSNLRELKKVEVTNREDVLKIETFLKRQSIFPEVYSEAILYSGRGLLSWM